MENNRGAWPHILFVTKSVPYPPTVGSSQRTAILIDALAQVGDVSLFVIGPPDRRPFLEDAGYRIAATAEPSAMGTSVLGRLLLRLFPEHAEKAWRVAAGVDADYRPDPGLAARLRQLLATDHFDLIVGRYLIPSAQAGLFGSDLPPTIIDIDDVDSKAVAAKIESPATGWLLRQIMRARRPAVGAYERDLWSKASRLWFANPDDQKLAPGIDTDVIPNIPFDIPLRGHLEHSTVDSRTILWVGSFNHRVNLEGVDHFLQQAWGKIRAVQPAARFRIVGSQLPDDMRLKWAALPGVDVVGYAESLAVHYAECAFSIVPLLDGAGTKIKVLESLAYMRTCVVTRHSIGGYEALLRDGDSIRAGLTLDDLVAPVTELLNQPQLRWSMEKRGRTVVEQHFIRKAVHTCVASSLQCLAQKSPP